ncbi:hypothetical protein BWR19_08405 [Halomonas sp. 1513]|nr:hypothetical protein BWR19_08405 [Halomonas sp. 1513]
MKIKKRKLIPARFTYYFKRGVLDAFPQHSTIALRSGNGRYLLWKGCYRASVFVPHGNDQLFNLLDQGASLNKKGYLAPTSDEIADRQQRYLKIYDSAKNTFDTLFGNPLFLMYGTLLGHCREGDFIPGDDDFDVGYASALGDPISVKEETKKIVIELVLAGYICSFNRSGRLFRLSLPGEPAGVHLDVRPVWYEDQAIWAHKQAKLPLSLDDFLPVIEGSLRGYNVYTPAYTERFLRAYYGDGWKVPDPSFSNASQKVPKYVIKHLDKTCITPAEYREMCDEIERRRPNHPQAAKLISIGLHSLYPLSEYKRECGW